MQKVQQNGGFQLPPDISFHKEHGPAGWVYTFRHQTLGQLGRILLQNRPDGLCHVSVEISGDPDDPMSEERAGPRYLGSNSASISEIGRGSADEGHSSVVAGNMVALRVVLLG